MWHIEGDEHVRAIGMLEEGRCQREVANSFNVSKSEISRLWNRYQQTKNVDDGPHLGRSRAMQEYRIDSFVTRLYEIDHKRQIMFLQTFIKLLVSEIRIRGLEIVFLQPVFMFDGPILTNRHTAHRREWYRER